MLQEAAVARLDTRATLTTHPSFTYLMKPLLHQMAATGASGAAILAILAAAPAPAQAVAACGPAPIDMGVVFGGSFACQFGNAIADSFASAFTLPTGVTGTAAFAFFDGIYDVDFSVNPGDSFTASPTFAYRLSLIDPAEQFVGAALDVNGNGVRPRPDTTYPGDYGGVALISDGVSPLAALVSINGARDPVGVGFTTFAGRNSILVSQGVATSPQEPSGIRPTINNASAQFITERRPDTVPGPLGVAGVGAMLATARRLRRRIQAV